MSGRRATARRKEEGGFALFVVVILVLTLSTLSLASFGRLADLGRSRERDRHALGAVWAAHGGVEASRAALSRDSAWTGGRIPVGRGEAVVTVETVPGRPDVRRVIAIGTDPGRANGTTGARLRVEAELRLAGGALPLVTGWREGP